MKSIFLLTSIALCLLAGCNSEYSKQQKELETATSLKLLGQVAIPYNHSFQNTVVGGLSGLAYDKSSDLFYVISDDRSQKSNARFYTLKIQLSDKGSLKEGGIHFIGVHILKTPELKPYKAGTIDAEGIALGSNGFVYISSEGDRRKGIAPFINSYTKDGRFVRALPLPGAFWNSNKVEKAEQGIRTNLAFEPLALSPNKQILYTATENALIQDGPAADSLHGSPSRIIVYDLPTGKIWHEFQYNVEPVNIVSGSHGSFMVNGITALEAIDNKGHLLALERNFVMGQGNHIALYKISIDSATDIKGVYSIKDSNKNIQPVRKERVARLNDFDINIDNFEGMTLGPKLSGDSRLLLMISDNNFSSTQQTLFTAFAIDLSL